MWARPSPAAVPSCPETAVRLVAPAADATLQAGSLAEISWEAQAPFDRLPAVEEWEAFLSLDGGAHYAVRITPHLDSGLRRVLWQVPATPTGDARLLLRFGDEHQETACELPQRFAIAAPSGRRLDLAPARLALTRGEPALPGQPGVVAWVEGTRHGGSARPVVAAEPPAAAPGRSMAESGGETAVCEAAGGPGFDPAAAVDAAGPVSLSAPHRASPAPERTDPAAPVPILLQSQRRNE